MNSAKLILFGAAFGMAMLVGCSDKSSSPSKEATAIPPDVRQSEPEKPASKESEEKHEYLEIKLSNNTGGSIDQTSVSFGSKQCTFGILGRGGSGTYLGWIKPVGTNAVVRWREEQKTARMSMVDLSKVYDPAKPGTLLFSIIGTNVTVTFTQIDRK